jgi:hypothetical protein
LVIKDDQRFLYTLNSLSPKKVRLAHGTIKKLFQSLSNRVIYFNARKNKILDYLSVLEHWVSHYIFRKTFTPIKSLSVLLRRYYLEEQYEFVIHRLLGPFDPSRVVLYHLFMKPFPFSRTYESYYFLLRRILNSTAHLFAIQLSNHLNFSQKFKGLHLQPFKTLILSASMLWCLVVSVGNDKVSCLDLF